jgi:hypothetical protein
MGNERSRIRQAAKMRLPLISPAADRRAEATAAPAPHVGDGADGDNQAEPAALPEFFGMLHSGKGDLAARSDEILRAEFGRR